MHRSSFILVTLFFCFSSLHAFAQNRVPLGLEEVADSAALETSDPLVDSTQYYKFITLELKAGAAVFAYMESAGFTPLMALVDASGTNTTVGQTEDLGTSRISYVAIHPPRDTTISLLFTSSEAMVTGKFTYGVKRFAPEQMLILDDFNLCERFTYMINHWQAAWMLYDTYTYYDLFDDLGFYVTTDNGLQADTRPMIRDGIYAEEVENSEELANAEEAYQGYIQAFTACLSKDQWNIHEVIADGVKTTYFTLLNFTDATTRASISVELNPESDTQFITTIRFY